MYAQAIQGKGYPMKLRICVLALIVLFLCLPACLPAAHAQEYGKIRALQQRAAHVINQKNDFVARVLTSYAIPHERNMQGAVVRIKMDGKWLDVTTIEIIPVLTETANKLARVTAHELLFSTAEGTLDLTSELTVR
jgi:hypothetical protein